MTRQEVLRGRISLDASNSSRYFCPVRSRGSFAVALLLLGLAHCDSADCLASDAECNPALGYLLYLVPAQTPLLIATSAPNTSAIQRHDTLTFTFDTKLDPSACSAGGTLGNASLSYSNNDTVVTLTPATNWTTGDARTLSLSGCRSANLNLAAADINYSYFVADAVAYVRTDGDDANAGTRDAPKLTIANSITTVTASCASAGTYCAVNVAAGDYNTTAAITPASRVSLFGGYSTDFQLRDPNNTYTSRILASTVGITVLTITSMTDIVIDGLRLETPASATTSPLSLDLSGSSDNVTIRNNDIRAGAYTGGGAFAPTALSVTATGTNNVVTRNRIEAGASNGSSPTIGVAIVGGGNRLDTMTNNVVIAGEMTGAGRSIGVQITGSNASLEHNTIIAGGTSTGITRVIELGGTLTISMNNNLIVSNGGTTNYCVFESNASSTPVAFGNNNLTGCSTNPYADQGAVNITSLTMTMVNSSCGGPLTLGGCGTLADAPVLDATTYAYTTTSPCTLTQGGVDLSASVTVDRNGNARTAPVSIGAFETDELCL